MNCRRAALASLAVLAALSFAASVPARAQLAELVLELDQGLTPLQAAANLGGYVEAGEPGRLFFTALTLPTGWEVWTTDGTSQGTRILGDFCPGTCPLFDPPALVSLGERVVWIGSLGGDTRGEDFGLWTSDGTPG
ncbi:MAG: hypothetical protein KDD47_18130, partial [Acidobacteria bacterium]|nr:hypothetical protein [Acidobacteriota bacterium]